PHVNTSQPFQILVCIANESETGAEDVEVQLSSDGRSIFDPAIVVSSITAHDTVGVIFDVLAAPQPDPSEQFRVDILNADIPQLPPLDNTALILIERPAELELVYELVGADDTLVCTGQEFGLSITLRNLGDAAASTGAFQLSTGGVDFGIDDPTIGSISVDEPLAFTFKAPLSETSARFSFILTQIPNDRNTGLPALTRDTSFQLGIQVQQRGGVLYVEPTFVSSNLVTPGQPKALFELSLTNQEFTGRADMGLQQITLCFSRPDGSPLDAALVLDPLLSGFLENDIQVTSAVASGDRLVLSFNNFLLAPEMTRAPTFSADFLTTMPSSFVLHLERRHIKAVFADGPNMGRAVEIISSTG
ncbi:MAG: hypothetical protein AB1744_15830, partial [Candidatus Zixiibacteriota bacterium]